MTETEGQIWHQKFLLRLPLIGYIAGMSESPRGSSLVQIKVRREWPWKLFAWFVLAASTVQVYGLSVSFPASNTWIWPLLWIAVIIGVIILLRPLEWLYYRFPWAWRREWRFQ